MESSKIINAKKAVIFDFDDTLAKTKLGKNLGLKIASFKIYKYLRKKGVKLSFSNFYRKTKKVTQEIEKKIIYDRNFWWLSIIKKFLDETPSVSFLDEITMAYWKAVMEKSEPYKDALSILIYLKKRKYCLGMITDTDGVKELKTKRIKNLDFKKWFDFIVVAGDDIKQTKPDNAPFLLISKKLNLEPQQCVFVGNSLHLDILGAKRAGMATILIKRDGCKLDVKPDRIINTLNELKSILF